MKIGNPFLWLLLLAVARSEEEVKWTSNPNDDGGPLPLSTKQREELTQLEQAIMSSPDPQATLQQVAASNNMTPQELAGMLQRNHADMAQQGNRSLLSTNPIVKLVSLVASRMKQHPKVSTAIVTIALFVLYLRLIEIPRSGIAISTSRSFVSKGPTTLLSPPNRFVEKLMEGIDETNLNVDERLFDQLEIPEVDEGKVKKIPKRAKLWKRAFVAEERISLQGLDEHAEEILLDQASRLLSDPSSLVEWIPSVRLSVDEDKAMLVYPGMGDYGRYALIPFLITEQSDQQLVFSTTMGSYFDGQIIVEIENTTVRVSMIVVRGRAPPTSFLQDMARSIAKSLQARTRQVVARRSQSERYRASSEAYTAKRRHQRDEKARAIEEMAADRRRRWQRQNPNSGHYRPSGDRMKSPNNAVY